MKPYRNQEYTQAARDQECVLCGANDGTTVASHIRLKGFCGTGTKPHDFMTVDACFECHNRLDGRGQRSLQGDYETILYALCRTWERRMGSLEDGGQGFVIERGTE